MAGKNDKGNNGYAGPCPPSGTHHYHFRVFALDASIARPASKAELVTAMRGHVLATGELVATYTRR
jgi:Raf kinase inhibitor-like YbhB/YbcL family protein